MLFIEKDPNSPFAATLFSDLRTPASPYAVCVVKARYQYCMNLHKWALDKTPPAFQTVDCWSSVTARQVTDLVPEKSQLEILLRGEVRSEARITLDNGKFQQTIQKTGRLAPTPTLYWQEEWQPRAASKKGLSHYLVAPRYGRMAALQGSDQSLCLQFEFDNLFSAKSVAKKSVFKLGEITIQGQLDPANQSRDVETTLEQLPFNQDTLLIDTDQGIMDCLWRARIPWDLMSDQQGRLKLSFYVWGNRPEMPHAVVNG